MEWIFAGVIILVLFIIWILNYNSTMKDALIGTLLAILIILAIPPLLWFFHWWFMIFTL